MIEFMIIAAPRSGTAWAANWLTTDRTLCLHDPLWNYDLDELDTIESPRKVGIACTGVVLFPAWLEAHPARKVILHRDLGEIEASMAQIGAPTLAPVWRSGILDRVSGMHVPWTDLMEKPREIYEYLTGLPFDPERHTLLKELAVERRIDRIEVNHGVMGRLLKDLRVQAN